MQHHLMEDQQLQENFIYHSDELPVVQYMLYLCHSQGRTRECGRKGTTFVPLIILLEELALEVLQT